MMLRSLIAVVLLFSLSLTFAQQQTHREKKPEAGIIKGTIVDGDTQKPVEYANIAIYKTADSSLAGGAVTDASGNFVIRDLPYGKFYVEANFIGYIKKHITDLKITPKNQSHALGQLTLDKATKELEGVDVVADRNRVEYKIDKKVINVAQDLNASGGTVTDALENVPSVQVDIEGNVQLRGSGNFRVLVNGKPTVLEGSDALQQIPADAVKNIEIITNPSAKYDPEGTAGIINVIMKKQKKQGLNGIVNLSAGLRDKYSGDFLLNYKVGKMNFFGGADYRNDNYYMNGNRNRTTEFSNDSLTFLDETSERVMQRKGYSIKAGFDYNFSEKSVLTLEAKYGNFGFGWDSENQTHFSTDPIGGERYYISKNQFQISRDYINLTLSYSKNFQEKDHKLEASAYYSNASINDTDSNEEIPADASFSPLSSMDAYKLESTEKGSRFHTRLKIDYTKPLWKGKLEAGYQGRLRNMNEDYSLSEFAPDLGGWKPKDASEIDLYRHIEAIYTTYSANFGEFGVMAGIRGEYTDRTLKQLSMNETHQVKRFDFFPSGHISYQLPAKQQLQASYSRRLNRPRGWFLDPLEQYQDAYNIRIGNPELEPEFTDSYELSYQKRLGMSFIAIEGFYKQKNNLITRLREVRDDGVMIHTFGNIHRDHSSGAEIMLNMEVFDWWRFNASASGYKYRIEGSYGDEDIDNTSNNWDARMNNTFKLPTNTRVQLMGFYRGPSVTAQGERSGFFHTSVAVKQELFNRAASLTLQVRDVLGTMKHEMTSEGVNYTMERTFQRESPMVSLNFSYRINNYKNKKRERSGESEFEGMGGQGM